MSKSISRRNFIKQGARGAAAVAAASAMPVKAQPVPLEPGPFNKWPGRYVLNFNKGVCFIPPTIVESVAMEMMDDGIKLLTGQSDLGLAWRSIFPTMTSNTKVAVKINMLGDQTWTSMELVKGMFEGMLLMPLDGGGTFSGSQFYIYDARNGRDEVSRGFDQTNFTGAHITHPCPYSTHGDGVWNKQYANDLNTCDYLVNFPVLKGHGSDHERFTIGFKNHWGTYPPLHVGGFAESSSPAFLRDVNCLGPVFNKTVLTVISAILAMVEGHGPSGAPDRFGTYVKSVDPTANNLAPCTMVMSTDPVTAEFQAIRIAKIQDGAVPANVDASIMPNYLKASGGDRSSALSTVRNIGQINPSNMDKGEIINGVITATPSPVKNNNLELKKQGGSLRIMGVNPNPFKGSCTIRFTCDPKIADRAGSLKIFNTGGKMVKSFVHTVRAGANSMVWDGKDSIGQSVPSGSYVLKLEVGGIVATEKIVMAR
jgi:hypothetical protein